jgi:hypothetical protein
MAEPTERTPAAAPQADGVSEVAASPPVASTARGFRFPGEDKSVHKALGGGKSMIIFPSQFLISPVLATLL